MSSTVGPIITKTLANQFRSTFVYGTFNNLDNSSSSIPARAAFQRDVFVGNNLFLGNAAVDASGAFLDSSSNIQFTLDKQIVNFPVTSLRFIKKLTSDVQQQLIDLSNNIVSNGKLNGLLKIYANYNTGFSSGNTEILGNNNTRFGFFNGLLSGYSNAVFGDQSLQNCTGNSNTAIGHNSQNSNTSYSYNTSLGSESNIIGGSSNIAIGHGAQCNNCSNSVALGVNVACTTSNQVLLGNSSQTIQIPGDLTCNGLISANRLSTSGDLTCNGLISANRLSTSGDLTCNGLITGNRLSTSGDLTCNGLITGNRLSTGIMTFSESINNISSTVFGYLSGVSSGIQEQLNTASTAITALNTKTVDVSWISGTINRTDIRNACSTHTLTFSNTLNNISTTTFSYLSGLTSNIQQQINAINTLPGTVIAFAGSASTLNGYLLCDGSAYNSANYSALYTSIGTIYGDAGDGTFRVPNYQGIFLRGAGQQDVQKQIIAGAGGAIFKNYQAPDLGRTVVDQLTYFSTNVYIDSISTGNKTVLTGSTLSGTTGFQTTNVVGNIDFSSSSNAYNFGNQESHPVHTSVQYFIKY